MSARFWIIFLDGLFGAAAAGIASLAALAMEPGTTRAQWSVSILGFVIGAIYGGIRAAKQYLDERDGAGRGRGRGASSSIVPLPPPGSRTTTAASPEPVARAGTPGGGASSSAGGGVLIVLAFVCAVVGLGVINLAAGFQAAGEHDNAHRLFASGAAFLLFAGSALLIHILSVRASNAHRATGFDRDG